MKIEIALNLIETKEKMWKRKLLLNGFDANELTTFDGLQKKRELLSSLKKTCTICFVGTARF